MATWALLYIFRHKAPILKRASRLNASFSANIDRGFHPQLVLAVRDVNDSTDESTAVLDDRLNVLTLGIDRAVPAAILNDSTK